MKIAFVSDAVYPYNKGGKEKRLYDIAKLLIRRGHQVDIYTMNWWRGKGKITAEGITLHGVCSVKKLYTGERRSIWQAVYFSLKVIFPLIRNKSDVIDVDHMPYFPLLAAKIVLFLKGKTMYATWHEVWGRQYWSQYLGKLGGSLAYLIEKIAVKTPSKIISVSELTTKRLVEQLKVKPSRIVTIPNGINYQKIIQPASATEKSDCIFVGRLLAHKKVDVLIKAVGKVKDTFSDIQCLIIGDGPEKKKLEKLATDLDLGQNIEFKGFLKSSRELYSLLKSARVFVLPSEREGFGIAALEANACGTPVITVRAENNATADFIIENHNGWLVGLDDNQAMAAKIIKAKKEGISSAMKHNCQQTAQKYDWGQVISQIENIYQLH
ncbi:glycosyltransferase family 4 protein [Patescibacteria group bacterium]|nr:glycosyltransferase family 4 protein [Patescibacteria group bacterium]